MTKIESLVTKARRYCMEKWEYWFEKYQKERAGNDFPYTYTDNDYNLFPRYNAISAIQSGIETIVGSEFNSIGECKENLIRLGNCSQSQFTTGTMNEIEKTAIMEERNKFEEFILNLSDDEMINVEPLPFIRRMPETESRSVRDKLSEIWNFDGGCWVPLENKCDRAIFISKDNISENEYKEIMDHIIKNSNETIFMITEDLLDYEIASSEFDPDRYETVYTDGTYQWIVYGSHEGTLAFGGERLVNKIKELYKTRQNLINKW